MRQLKNEIQRMLALADAVLGPELLSPQVLHAGDESQQQELAFSGQCAATWKERLDQLESQIIRETLTRHRWNKTRAASELGLSRVGLPATSWCATDWAKGLMAWWWVRMLLACAWPAGSCPQGRSRCGWGCWPGWARTAPPRNGRRCWMRWPAGCRHIPCTHAIWIWMPWTPPWRGELDFVITSPGHYVALEARHGVSRIATQQIAAGHDSAHAVAATVIVPATDSTRRRLADLRDARLAMVTPASVWWLSSDLGRAQARRG